MSSGSGEVQSVYLSTEFVHHKNAELAGTMLHLLSVLLDALDLSQRQALFPYYAYIVGGSPCELQKILLTKRR